jgi:magnesium-transporting ATPase (P-type)
LFFIRTLYRGQLSWHGLKGTRLIWMAIGLVMMAQALVTYTPSGQQIFKTWPLSMLDVVGILIAGFGFLMMLELERRVRHRVMKQ